MIPYPVPITKDLWKVSARTSQGEDFEILRLPVFNPIEEIVGINLEQKENSLSSFVMLTFHATPEIDFGPPGQI